MRMPKLGIMPQEVPTYPSPKHHWSHVRYPVTYIHTHINVHLCHFDFIYGLHNSRVITHNGVLAHSMLTKVGLGEHQWLLLNCRLCLSCDLVPITSVMVFPLLNTEMCGVEGLGVRYSGNGGWDKGDHFVHLTCHSWLYFLLVVITMVTVFTHEGCKELSQFMRTMTMLGLLLHVRSNYSLFILCGKKKI